MKNFKAAFIKCYRKTLNFVSSTLFPDNLKCIFCGRDIADFEEKPYCKACEKEISFNIGNRCLICDAPIGNEARVCDTCQKNTRYFKKAFCPFVYEGLVRKNILAYKDSNARYKGRAFAKLISNHIREENVKIDCVTYIPMTKKKQKQRTFNQSKLLAEEIAKNLGLTVMDCFEKLKDNKGQKFSSYKERQENMIGTYALKKVKLSKKSTILIVDDVITTCATVNFCAGLISKRVKDVYVCAIARNRLKLQKEP